MASDLARFKSSSSCLSDHWQRQFLAVINRFKSVFQPTADKVGLFKDGNHQPLHLPLTSKIYTRPQKVPPIPDKMLGYWADQMRIWRENNIVVPKDKQLPYLNPVLAVPKGANDVRFVINAIELNKVLEDEVLQLERPEVILQAMANRHWYIAMDISAFYLNFLVDEASSDLLAFRDPLSNRIWKLTRSIFGVKGSGSYSCRLLAEELEKIPEFNTFIFSYADDLLISADTEDQLLRLFSSLLSVLDECKLLIKPKKTKIGYKSLDVFGYTVSVRGMQPSLSRIKSLVETPVPTSTKQLISHLSSLSYFRNNFPPQAPMAKFSALFSHLTKNNVPFRWTETDTVNWRLMHEAAGECILKNRILDSDDHIIIRSDASELYYGWVVTAKRGDSEVIINTGSKLWTASSQPVRQSFHTVN